MLHNEKKTVFFLLTLAVQSPMVKKFFGKNGLRCNAKRIFKSTILIDL